MNAIAAALKHDRELYICSECAEGAGAVWPKGHAATWHSEWPCQVCGRDVALCAMSDWEWPGEAGRRMKERRET